ncbi:MULTISPECIES: flagellar motor protein MotB [Pseudoxanthomonas]|uniref:Chemotaxis protein MotB n=1 Tax=Pseudoxanthomonas taiwanensis J19 TaxID=935569 RepID=A0A562E371_9GAMM|nr:MULTISPECIES: flagellar motor protein MotB [Pseudoxanthomonas]RRN81033.1 histidine kinase [Pseudoxanthomonas sp. SGD-10]TWH16456.1 chemotaxis protein MotB [Pseudoxanthomonas taiwanensis J19]
MSPDGSGGDPAQRGARPARAGAETTIIKRGGRGHGHDDEHGGTWKVAFADFCLALMCLFLVLWLISSREEEAVRKLSQSLAYEGGTGLLPGEGGQRDDRGLGEVPAETPHGEPVDGQQAEQEQPRFYELPQDMQQLAERLRQLGEEAGLEDNLGLAITDQGLRVMLHDTDRRGVFRLGSAVPNERFRDLLRRLGAVFAGVGNPIVLVGHTDALPYREAGGAARSNWHLSSERALAARTLLLEGGMPDTAVLQSVGMAANAPLTPDDPTAAVNRRIEFMILDAGHADAMRRMFGVPLSPRPLIEGVQMVGSGPATAAP